MNSNTVYSCGLLLLLLIQVQARPRPQHDLQTLSRILEEELERLLIQEELDSEADDTAVGEASPEVESVQPESELPWDRDSRDFQTRHSLHDARLTRLLAYSPLRFRARNKKGSARGCFGGKLDRIGAMSDLGC